MNQDQKSVIEIAARAVQLYAETHPRPAQVTQAQAAAMIGVSRPTLSRMVKAGTLRLNACGQIPITEVDRVLASGRAA
ncbi:MAG: DNA-binding protein [Rhodocyclales bacterium]|nr:DNA-binding protein [Rhodocyclales bacterium]